MKMLQNMIHHFRSKFFFRPPKNAIFDIESEINKKMRIDNSVIRHLIVKYKNLDLKNEYFKKEK